uniref:NADH:ubiquinone reductase (non-electrogenic) n=1 Tax=Babesia bovis TaxID=5865 RepID=S6B693_BABBO|nr:NADH dehydrogenase, putative [Babesia bovis]
MEVMLRSSQLMASSVCCMKGRSLNTYTYSLLYFTRARYVSVRRTFSSTTEQRDHKQRVVVLGTGWSSLFFVKNLDLSKFDLQVVSPRNYFTFTPLLPKLVSGRISTRTCTVPFSSFVQKHRKGSFNFVHASCVNVDPHSKLVYCVSASDPNTRVNLPYDRLVIAVGAESNTFGIPGVAEHAYFMKEVEHANIIYQKIISNFEQASLPGISEEEKRRLLHLVIVGGGPTGVETTGEIAILLNKMAQSFPAVASYVKVTIVERGQRLLGTFSLGNSQYADRVLSAKDVNILLGKQVCAVGENDCTVKDATTGETVTMPCGIVLWASGLKQLELVDKVRAHFKVQNNPRALLVDQHLALRGTGDHSIFAVGDCCKILPDKLSEHFDEVSKAIGGTTPDALLRNLKTLSWRFPQVSSNKLNPKDPAFVEFLNKLSISEKPPKEQLLELMDYIDSRYMPPFPTAQNAKQESVYLANLFNKGFNIQGTAAFNDVWKGSLASIGGKHVVGNFPHFSLNGGIKAFVLWLGVYLTMFPSGKMRFCYLGDSLVQTLYGRHLITKQHSLER